MQGRAGSASVPTIGFTVLRFRNDEVRDARNGVMFEVLAVPGAIGKRSGTGDCRALQHLPHLVSVLISRRHGNRRLPFWRPQDV